MKIWKIKKCTVLLNNLIKKQNLSLYCQAATKPASSANIIELDYRGCTSEKFWEHLFLVYKIVVRSSLSQKIYSAFRLLKNAGIAVFSNLRDMHCWNDNSCDEKKRQTACLGKRKRERGNWKVADWIFGEIETEFDENRKMQVDFVGWTDELWKGH